MISTDFAPNEKSADALLALQLLFQPWKWGRGKDINNLKRRLKSRFFSLDTHISLFFSGRGALYQYLSSLGLSPEDEVLVQAFTCEAVVLPIIELGLHPVYVDITREDFSMDLRDLKKKCSDRAHVLILQHTFGITPRKRDEILAFAKAQKLQVIEDVAHGFDAELFKKKRFQSAVLMSFGRSKAFSSVFGGAIAIRGKKNAQLMRDAEKNIPNPPIAFHLQLLFYKMNAVFIKKTYSLFLGKLLHFVYKQLNLFVPEISKKEKNGRFDMQFLRTYPNSAAIFMHAQLDRFNDVLHRRKKTVQYYNKQLASSVLYDQALIRYPYLTDDPAKLRSQATKKNVYLGRWYSQVVAPGELDLRAVQYKKGSCPVAEKVTEEVINLPTNITQKEAIAVVSIIQNQ